MADEADEMCEDRDAEAEDTADDTLALASAGDLILTLTVVVAEEAEAAIYSVGRQGLGQVPIAVCDMTGQCVRRGSPCIDLAWLQGPQHARATMQLKLLDQFFSHELNLTGAQRRAMESWLVDRRSFPTIRDGTTPSSQASECLQGFGG